MLNVKASLFGGFGGEIDAGLRLIHSQKYSDRNGTKPAREQSKFGDLRNSGYDHNEDAARRYRRWMGKKAERWQTADWTYALQGFAPDERLNMTKATRTRPDEQSDGDRAYPRDTQSQRAATTAHRLHRVALPPGADPADNLESVRG